MLDRVYHGCASSYMSDQHVRNLGQNLDNLGSTTTRRENKHLHGSFHEFIRHLWLILYWQHFKLRKCNWQKAQIAFRFRLLASTCMVMACGPNLYFTEALISTTALMLRNHSSDPNTQLSHRPCLFFFVCFFFCPLDCLETKKRKNL